MTTYIIQSWTGARWALVSGWRMTTQDQRDAARERLAREPEYQVGRLRIVAVPTFHPIERTHKWARYPR